MTHPKKEQLITFSYGECEPSEQKEIQHHLKSCGECQTQVNEWSHAKKSLNAWKVTAPATQFHRFGPPMLKWGIAAALFVSFGFGLNSVVAGRQNEAMTRKIATQIQKESQVHYEALLQKEIADSRAALIAEFKQLRDQDRQDFIQTMQSLDQERSGEVSELRKDLETVALNAAAKLRRTERELGQLAILTSLQTSETTPKN